MSAPNPVLGTLIADLMSMPSMLHDAFLRTAEYVGIDLQSYIQENKLEGQVLRHVTGKLSGSVRYQVDDRGSEVAVIVSAGGGVAPYAEVHEKGGTFVIPEHASMTAAGVAYTVRAHEATFPQRAFMEPSLLEREDLYYEMFGAAAYEAMGVE